MFWPEPTHQPTHPSTHPPNYTPTHELGSLHRFQIFKQNWNISISSSAIEFWLIPGVPSPGGGGWVDVGRGGEGVGGCGWGVMRGCPHTHTHARTCMHMRTYDIIGNSQGFPKNPMEAAICMKLSCLPCMCVHACTCMYVPACAHVWGAPPNHPHPIHPSPNHPPPPSTEPPTPRAAGSRKHKKSISLELIEIIRFCLKIHYLWTFLNS